jgi:Uncharacterized conserved protein
MKAAVFAAGVRYRVTTDPPVGDGLLCRFCQRATGALGMVEPIFDTQDFEVTKGAPKTYTHISTGSGKGVYVHFCDACGTKTHLTFERWPDRLGLYAGTFDDPGWYEFSPDNSKYIFLDSAVRGTLVPPGFKVYRQHAATAEGVPLDPEVLDEVLHLR